MDKKVICDISAGASYYGVKEYWRIIRVRKEPADDYQRRIVITTTEMRELNIEGEKVTSTTKTDVIRLTLHEAKCLASALRRAVTA